MRRGYENQISTPLEAEMNQVLPLLDGYFKEGNISGLAHSLQIFNFEGFRKDKKFCKRMMVGVELLSKKQKENTSNSHDYQEIINKINEMFGGEIPQA